MVNMTNIGPKAATLRTAKAVSGVALPLEAYTALKKNLLPKGDVLTAAKMAGIMAAKDASRIIPLCHQINLSNVSIELKTFGPMDVEDGATIDPKNMPLGQGVSIEATAQADAATGVEMESLLAAQVAALTIYDMTKGLGLGTVILPTVLMEKTGGKDGPYQRYAPSPPGDSQNLASVTDKKTGRLRNMASRPESRREPIALMDYIYGGRVTFPDFKLPHLPYAAGELALGGISAEQVTFHHKKHHNAYVVKLIAMLKDHPSLQCSTVEELLNKKDELPPGVYNQAAQVYNHSLYFHGMRPYEWVAQGWSSEHPCDRVPLLRDAIDSRWGSFEAFKGEFSKQALSHFGSGWVWLVQERMTGGLKIVQTHDAKTPDLKEYFPLLTCDVWEHAYYIDQRNNRAAYLDNWWKLVNWEFVSSRMMAE